MRKILIAVIVAVFGILANRGQGSAQENGIDKKIAEKLIEMKKEIDALNALLKVERAKAISLARENARLREELSVANKGLGAEKARADRLSLELLEKVLLIRRLNAKPEGTAPHSLDPCAGESRTSIPRVTLCRSM